MEICQNSPIIFDVREYYPSQGEDSLIFNLFEKKERIRLCNLYLKRCSLLFDKFWIIKYPNYKDYHYQPIIPTQKPLIRSCEVFWIFILIKQKGRI